MYPECILQNTVSCTYPVYSVRILCEPLYSGQDTYSIHCILMYPHVSYCILGMHWNTRQDTAGCINVCILPRELGLVYTTSGGRTSRFKKKPGTNRDTEHENMLELKKLPGEMHVFEAQDTLDVDESASPSLTMLLPLPRLVGPCQAAQWQAGRQRAWQRQRRPWWVQCRRWAEGVCR